MNTVTKSEITKRINEFYNRMNSAHPDWDIAVISSEVNLYYFTGTIQNGLLVFLPNGDYYYFIKKSIARAKMESPIANIYPMKSYRDIHSNRKWF